MFDELNVLQTKRTKKKAIPLEEYFGEMDLDEDQIEERLGFSLKMRDLLLIVFSLVELGKIDRAERELEDGYKSIAEEYGEIDINFDSYIKRIVKEIVNATVDHLDDEYYTSADRALFIAENEANTTLNNVDMKRAIASGKKYKTWISMRDKRVRDDHKEVDGETIPIDGYFLVGSSLMRYPKDYEGINVTAEQTVNCRCSIQYK